MCWTIEALTPHARKDRLAHPPPPTPNKYIMLLIIMLPVFRGVGPKIAHTLVSALGHDKVLDVLNSDSAVEVLAAIKGIGKGKAAQIKEDWDKSEGEGGQGGAREGGWVCGADVHRVFMQEHALSRGAR